MAESDAIAKRMRRSRLTIARMAAVQAAYVMEQTGISTRAVVADFMDGFLPLDPEGEPLDDADPDLYRSLVDGVVARQEQIDAAISARLAAGWRIDRLDAVSRAILRVCACELLIDPGLPSEIALDEYVTLAHAYFEGDEPRFINGVLDRIAVDLRAPAR